MQSTSKNLFNPLDNYRLLATFDWKQLKVFIRGQKFIDEMQQLSDELKKYPEFHLNNSGTLSLSDVRQRAVRQMFLVYILGAFTDRYNTSSSYVLRAMNLSFVLKGNLAFKLFPETLQYLGTERHNDLSRKANCGEIIGCFALTEIGHGSNTKGMKTTVTYDVQTKEFVIHSPNFEAAKCWVGLLGQTATYAIVFAHLMTPDGVKRGLHAFVVPIRDPQTLTPYPGVTIVDMGEKIGLNGMDNALIMFNNYRIPRENLLNRLSDVAEDGTYQSTYKDPNKQHGASFANLSSGRIGICLHNVVIMAKALTIAIRYSAVRKQFGIDNSDQEIPILEYQTHQYRLMPYLAANYCLDIFTNYLTQYSKPNNETQGTLSEISTELHAISSACKPLSSWICRDAIQECREACGGHGYLKAAGLGVLRNDQDPATTYEGANHVLLQQTSKWLLKFWPLISNGAKINTPFKTVDFLNNSATLAHAKFMATSVEDVQKPKTIIDAYQWLVYFLLKRYSEKYSSNLKSGQNPIVAQNNSQIYVAIDLAIVYIQHFVLLKMLEFINQCNDTALKAVLTKLWSLYGLWSLHKHLPALYMGGYATGSNPGCLIEDAILKLCAELKNEAMALIDVIAPPDFILDSVLGNSDGQVYKRLEAEMMQTPGALSRPSWWKEVVYWKDYVKAKM